MYTPLDRGCLNGVFSEFLGQFLEVFMTMSPSPCRFERLDCCHATSIDNKNKFNNTLYSYLNYNYTVQMLCMVKTETKSITIATITCSFAIKYRFRLIVLKDPILKDSHNFVKCKNP